MKAKLPMGLLDRAMPSSIAAPCLALTCALVTISCDVSEVQAATQSERPGHPTIPAYREPIVSQVRQPSNKSTSAGSAAPELERLSRRDKSLAKAGENGTRTDIPRDSARAALLADLADPLIALDETSRTRVSHELRSEADQTGGNLRTISTRAINLLAELSSQWPELSSGERFRGVLVLTMDLVDAERTSVLTIMSQRLGLAQQRCVKLNGSLQRVKTLDDPAAELALRNMLDEAQDEVESLGVAIGRLEGLAEQVAHRLENVSSLDFSIGVERDAYIGILRRELGL